ncbi:MAG: hypothetical protein HY979_01590 [Candidatus Magasanikbacteria bacterium]|nr:hypothetical protein [Candidatus Magasanikbacteria bacterium]
MTLKQYLYLMATGTLICWIAWFFLLFNTDPQEASLLIFAFFYISLFLGIVGLFSVIGFLIKSRRMMQDDAVFRQVKKTFTQGILLGAFTIFILILRQFNLLFWWNAIFLVVLYVLIEGVILSGRKYHNRDYV